MLSNILWWPWAQIGGAAPPVVIEYHPVGDSSPPLALAELEGLPPRRGRRRRRESIFDMDEDVVITVLLDEL